MREYVKEFSSLMLDIKNMFEEDKLFNFVSGLQGWVQTELRRQGVKDLSAAMVVADCLVDYKLSGSTSIGKKQKPEGFKKHKAVGKHLDQVEGKKGGMVVVPKVGDVSTNQNVHQASKPVGCFICQRPHQSKDCPRREKLSTLQNTKEEDSDLDDSSPQLNPLQVVTTLHTPMFFLSTNVCVCSFEWDRCERDD